MKFRKESKMEKYNIQITEPAENDLHQIRNYISEELLESAVANRIINKIGEAIFTLEEMPVRNAIVSDKRLAAQGIRKILIENYIVFYIVSEENKMVTVLRILYCRRNWVDLL
ncbi:MAG: type II toxin-antitoxin system RelE/ParE family toxin [Ignavibacteriales bacterium]